MSWLARVLGTGPAGSSHIGPGRLVLVVGPSGAGKDTLIDSARAACRHDPDVVFPRRTVTRPSSAAEDHDTLSEHAFDQAVTEGAFAIWWSAHGLRYGIPLSIDTDIRAGRTVVCNVSRSVVGAGRKRYARVVVVLVTAPQAILAARLAERKRGTDGAVADRVNRSVMSDAELAPDVVIENTGSVEAGTKHLVHAISGQILILEL